MLFLLALLPLGLAAQAFSPPAGLIWTELFCFALPAAALPAWAGLEPGRFLGLRPPPRRSLLLAAPLGAVAMLTAGALQALWEGLLPDAVVEAFDVTRLFAGPPLALAVLVGAATLLAPLCEELAFRGHLLSALRLRWRPGPAIGLSALAFAAIHLDPVRFPALLFLGVLYGWMRWRTGSVWPAVLAHAVNNAAATSVALAWRDVSQAVRPPEVPGEPSLALLASLALLVPLLLAYQRVMPPAPVPEGSLARGTLRPGRRPRWAAAAAWAATITLALIGILGRR
jgi:membrane protease YdiL (CAAX protease family)